MDANRWNEFRKDLERVYLHMKHNLGRPSDVDQYFQPLVEKYPELHTSYKENEEPTRSKIKNEHEMTEEKAEEEVSTPRVKQKSKEEIKEILVKSLENRDTLKDYYQHVDMKTETEQDCLEALCILNKAVSDARKRIVFFTAMQGKVLHKLRGITKCSVNNLIEKTGYSSSYVYFILKLYALISEFDKLRHSDLKLSFFKTNMKIITEICKEDRNQFQ